MSNRTPARSNLLPRWLDLLIGLIVVVIGVVLVLHPFASLSVLVLLVIIGATVHGVASLIDTRRSARPWLTMLTGALWLIAAVTVAIWPGITIQVLTVVIGIALLADGAVGIVSAFRADTDQRINELILGAASMTFGVLALAWPSITVFVLALVFGVCLVIAGLSRAWQALRGNRFESADDAQAGSTGRPRTRRWLRTTGAVASLLVAFALVAVSSALHRSEPSPDAFYTAPDGVPLQPGTLLRSEPFTRDVPDTAQAWRILYTTSRNDQTPAVASGIVLVAKDGPAGPRPVVAWAHGTTGYDESCAPSLLAHPFAAGAMPAMSQVIERGWVLVATDYVGLGTAGPHPYLIGEGEARSVIDAVRAARQLDGVNVGDQTVVWGHSQGGHAALWTGQLAGTYGADIGVAGVAAIAPASNLTGLVGNLDTVAGGPLFASYIVQAYSDTYPDVVFEDYIKPAARVQVRELAARCLSGPEAIVSVIESLLFDQSIFSQRPDEGPFGARLAQNIPLAAMTVPLLVAQGEADALVLPSAQRAYVQQRCELGDQQVEYRTYPGRDHVGVVADDSPLVTDLVAWTQDRFDGRAAPSTCAGATGG